MNFSVYNNLPIGKVYGGVIPPYNTTVPRYTKPGDSLSVNRELDRVLNESVIQDMIDSNPVVLSILKSHNLKPTINLTNFKDTTYNHCVDTRNIALGIYNNLPVDLKQGANVRYIQKGALLHDIGKVLIPEKIMNKTGKLNEKETEIMHLHSKLGEALLSSQNIEPEVLNIVKYHHQNKSGMGYPQINTLGGFDVNTEIVALADKYSALTEKRAYKDGMDSEKALSIIKEEVDKGEISPRIYNALVGYINNTKKAKESVAA